MTRFDILLLVIALIALAIGFHRGIITQIGSLAGIIVGIILSRITAPWVAQLIAGDAIPSYPETVVAHILMFVVGFLGCWALARLFRSLTHALHLGFIDRLAGALFTLLEWLLILSLALNLYLALRPETDISTFSSLADGQAFILLRNLAPTLTGWLLP